MCRMLEECTKGSNMGKLGKILKTGQSKVADLVRQL